MYNLTALSEVNGFGDVFEFADQAAGISIHLGGLFSIAFFFIMLISLSMRGHQFEDSLLASSWVCFVINLIFWYVGQSHWLVMTAFLVIGAAAAMLKVTVRKGQ